MAKNNEVDALAAMELDWEPEHQPKPSSGTLWTPDLNPTQRLIFDDATPFILCYGEKGCRTLDTMVYTASGLKRIGRMAPIGAKPGFNPIAVEIMATPSVAAFADAYWVEADRSAIRAELSHGGEITGSPRHPLYACWESPSGEYAFGWEKLSDIQSKRALGWRFWTPIVGHSQWNTTGKIHPDLAYAIGALVGDGSCNCIDDRSVGFTNQDQECIDRVRLGLRLINAELRPTAQTIQFNIGPRRAIRPVLAELGLIGLAHQKRIPDAIIEGSKASASAFLRGLFDTDGTTEKNGVVSLTTTSEALGKDVQDLLAAFGILCVRRPKKTASGRPTWTLSIMGRHAYAFGRVIGFEIKRKRARIRGPKPSFRNPSGFNGNYYGYPGPIRTAMRAIAGESRTGVKKPQDGVVHRSRKWHDQHRRLHSFKSVPQRHKVDQFCEIYSCKEKLAGFLKSETWVEIEHLSSTEADLADLHVPGHHSFIAAGTINHNSGKSVGAEHKLVRHCHENWDALGVIVTPSIRTGKFGVMHDLENLVLPAWTDGIGLEWLPSRLDPSTKDRILKMANRFGGWSTILQISIPYEEAIASRIKGIAPSIILADELTDCDGRGYFSLLVGQLNRRRHITGPQQYIATCNPKGPSNWVYQVFIEEPFDTETGVHDVNFKVYHVPFRENAHRPEVQGYLATLERAVKGDPIERARLIDGKWVERPTGDALFRDYFIASRHVVGDIHAGTGLRPVKGLPCVVGYDLGQVYSTAVFMQYVPVDGGHVWIIFDEVVHLKERILYKTMAREVCEKMRIWNEENGEPFAWEHITDDSAVNQWRPGSGSYDAWEFELEFNKFSIQHSLPQMRMRGCPKGSGSVEARVRLVQGSLHQDQLLVSASCPHVIDAMMMLEGKEDEPMTPKKTAAGHIHVFDGWSYPMLKYSLGGASVYTGAAIKSIVTVS